MGRLLLLYESVLIYESIQYISERVASISCSFPMPSEYSTVQNFLFEFVADWMFWLEVIIDDAVDQRRIPSHKGLFPTTN
jgi:hypothetical protein